MYLLVHLAISTNIYALNELLPAYESILLALHSFFLFEQQRLSSGNNDGSFFGGFPVWICFKIHLMWVVLAGLGGSVGCGVRLETRRSQFKPRRGRQHSFVEIDHEIFSTVILSLPLTQEGQLSVSGERMCTILVNRLED